MLFTGIGLQKQLWGGDKEGDEMFWTSYGDL